MQARSISKSGCSNTVRRQQHPLMLDGSFLNSYKPALRMPRRRRPASNPQDTGNGTPDGVHRCLVPEEKSQHGALSGSCEQNWGYVAVETTPATNSLPCRFPPCGIASKSCALLRDKTLDRLTTDQVTVSPGSSRLSCRTASRSSSTASSAAASLIATIRSSRPAMAKNVDSTSSEWRASAIRCAPLGP